jgi:hypothetical protein
MTASVVIFIDGTENSRFEVLDDGPYEMLLPEIDDGEHNLTLRLDLEPSSSDPTEMSPDPFDVYGGPPAHPFTVYSDPPAVRFNLHISVEGLDKITPPDSDRPADPPSARPAIRQAPPPPLPPPTVTLAAAAGADDEARVAYWAFHFPPPGHCFVNAADVVVAVGITDGYFRSSLPSSRPRLRPWTSRPAESPASQPAAHLRGPGPAVRTEGRPA